MKYLKEYNTVVTKNKVMSHQESLFGNSEERNNMEEIPTIDGLQYLPSFLSMEEHDELWKAINKESWLDDLKRRVQHYGFKYDYRRRNIDESMRVSPLPKWVSFITKRLVENGIMEMEPDQLIVNEYEPGQGIASHIDCEPCFDDTIVSISLGSPCNMEFTNYKDKHDKIQLLLEICSAIVLSGDARYKWLHGINATKSYKRNNKRIPRERRISLTFRKVILDTSSRGKKQENKVTSEGKLDIELKRAISEKETAKIPMLCRSILEVAYGDFAKKHGVSVQNGNQDLEQISKDTSLFLDQNFKGFKLENYKLPRFLVHSIKKAEASDNIIGNFKYSEYLAQVTLLTCQLLEDLSKEIENNK